MKRKLGILVLLLSLSIITANAQTAATGTAKPKQAAAPKLTEKDIMMCDKEWHAISVEEWGVITKPPGEKSKNDMLKLTQDGKFELVLFGVKKAGKWTKAGQYIYFTDEATKGKLSYKVISIEPTKFKIDHYSDEEGHSIFEYEAK